MKYLDTQQMTESNLTTQDIIERELGDRYLIMYVRNSYVSI